MKYIIKTSLLTYALVFAAALANAGEPTLTVNNPLALDDKGSTQLSGSGFAPNHEVIVLLSTADGVDSDIGYALEPAPVADANGNWQSAWNYGRFVSKKLVGTGAYQLTATDADFVPLATATLNFE